MNTSCKTFTYASSYNLINGIDYEDTETDYDELYNTILSETFTSPHTSTNHHQRSPHEPLWDFLDISFDYAARNPIHLGVELIFKAAERFCTAHKISLIPPLYQYMFDAATGFLTQAKLPWLMCEQWTKYFPEPLTNTNTISSSKMHTYTYTSHHDTLKLFHDFLIEKDEQYTLQALKKFMDGLQHQTTPPPLL